MECQHSINDFSSVGPRPRMPRVWVPPVGPILIVHSGSDYEYRSFHFDISGWRCACCPSDGAIKKSRERELLASSDINRLRGVLAGLRAF